MADASLGLRRCLVTDVVAFAEVWEFAFEPVRGAMIFAEGDVCNFIGDIRESWNRSVWICVENQDGHLVAGSQWFVYTQAPERDQFYRRSSRPLAAQDAKDASTLGNMVFSNRFQDAKARGPHILCAWVFTHPAHRRHGAGKQMKSVTRGRISPRTNQDDSNLRDSRQNTFGRDIFTQRDQLKP